jgi:hypothetical protein
MGAAAAWGTACMTGYLQLFNLEFLFITNFWIEWKQNKIFNWISGIMTIGIFADKQSLIDNAIDAYKHGWNSN